VQGDQFDNRMKIERKQQTRKVSCYGGFGLGNFGNEATLQATLRSLRRLLPNVECTCICTNPEITAINHGIATVPISAPVIEAWKPQNRMLRALRSLVIGIPNELYRWVEAFRALRYTDALIIPGTGLLTDAFGLRSWGPYNLWKWCLIAKVRGCKLAFLSVGAGPIYTRTGRWLVKSALSLADFRSYRDEETRDFLQPIVPVAGNDRVYPDLAFSLVDQVKLKSGNPTRRRSVVGLGLMLYHRKLSGDEGRASTYAAYLDQLVLFVQWLLDHDYDIRLLIGELSDLAVLAEFKALLKDRLPVYDEDRILAEEIRSAEDLLVQLADSDVVVGTRFHNILLALVLDKPVISISFHQKCTSLMRSMELADYCQDIQQLDVRKLVEQFRMVEQNADGLKQMIRRKAADRRDALEEQYGLILKDLFGQAIAANSSQAPSVAASI
jgi:polysaccharide pyruvyl transferase WcaK-like protein